MAIKYLHTMVRVKHIDRSLNFYCNLLGLKEIRRKDNEQGKFTLIFLAPPDQPDAMIELTSVSYTHLTLPTMIGV